MDETFPDIVQLNVGGMMVATHLSTLVKDENSMLAAMFSGRHLVSKDKDGRYFIDADGDLFRHILEFLRFGKIPSKEQALNVYQYAEYFGITDLIKALELFPEVRNFLRKRSYDKDLNLNIQLYEALKLEAIEKIDALYDTKNILLAAYITNPSATCWYGRKCQPRMDVNSLSTELQHANIPLTCVHIIILSVQSESCTGLSKRLAFDLRELGFSKYTYYLHSEVTVRCEVCNECIGRIEAILLDNTTSESAMLIWKKP